MKKWIQEKKDLINAKIAEREEQQRQEQQKQLKQQQQQQSSPSHHQQQSYQSNQNLSWKERALQAQALLKEKFSSTDQTVSGTPARTPGGPPPPDSWREKAKRARVRAESLLRSSSSRILNDAEKQTVKLKAKKWENVEKQCLGLSFGLLRKFVLVRCVDDKEDLNRLSLVSRAFYLTLQNSPLCGWRLVCRDSLDVVVRRCAQVARFSRFSAIALHPQIHVRPFAKRSSVLQLRCLGGGSVENLCKLADQTGDGGVPTVHAAPLLHVRTLDLSHCDSKRDFGWHSTQPLEQLNSLVALQHLTLGTLTFPAVERLWTVLARVAPNLRSLDASFVNVSLADVLQLTQLESLRTLRIRSDAWSAERVVTLPAQVRHLTLRGGVLDSEAVNALATRFAGLRSLSCSIGVGTRRAKLPGVTELVRRGLRQLELRSSSSRDAAAVVTKHIAAAAPSDKVRLRSLIVGRISGRDNDALVECVKRCAEHLRVLSVSSANSEPLDGALALLAKANLAEQLTLDGCSDRGLRQLAATRFLVQLSLCGCQQLSQQGIEEALQNSHMLQVVDLSRVSAAANALGALAPQWRQLTTLRVADVPIDDKCIAALAKHCTQLRELDIARNKTLRVEALNAAFAQWRLRRLNIVGIGASDDSLLETLATGLSTQTLSEIALSDTVDAWSRRAVQFLQLCKVLRVISLDRSEEDSSDDEADADDNETTIVNREETRTFNSIVKQQLLVANSSIQFEAI